MLKFCCTMMATIMALNLPYPGSANYAQAKVYPWGPETIANIARLCIPAVANINTVEQRRNPMLELEPFFHGFFGTEGSQLPAFFETKGIGSAFAVAADGLLITNWHVVKKAKIITVAFQSGKQYPGRVVGYDALADLALLRVHANDLPILPIDRNDDLQVGEWVVAIGNPLGLTTTVTAGIVSGIRRGLAINESIPFIQTDTPINPGNSGGPLLDLQGQVVGVNTAIIRNVSGISFAIPAQTLRSVLIKLQTSSAPGKT
ncbi:MAG: trypsin-like peptidase domain-containing protein [Cyanobacteria bacterium NC_groundwater_1444_Ag_S-0.65um_54_12]|nr:trypsin-like peptidase domain-containing protein [Cyanobacteria bacterium NC_groundwater_1444_Ag_S-0.65um_54_12]